MARVGERSHHRGGPITLWPAGSGPHGLGRCRVADQQAAGAAGKKAQKGSVSARQLGTVQSD